MIVRIRITPVYLNDFWMEFKFDKKESTEEIANQIQKLLQIYISGMLWPYSWALESVTDEVVQNHMKYISEQDEAEMRKLNEVNDWGFSQEDLFEIIDKYEQAYKSNDNRTMGMIECRLEDANFHEEMGMLIDGMFDELRKKVKEW